MTSTEHQQPSSPAQSSRGLAVADRAFGDAIATIAETVAGVHADSVDHEGRFPGEAVDALRHAGALSAFIPTRLGGGGVSLEAVAQGCFALGQHCAATAMVFAMHNIQLAFLDRHSGGSVWFEEYLRRVSAQQRLIASVTSEVATGGDMGRSVAPFSRRADGRFALAKDAQTISYGLEADDYLTTLRRSETAPETDQIFVLHHREDTSITQTGTWNTLGMRGTMSPGFRIEAHADAAQALADPVSTVVIETMPITFVLWSHVWLGIATAAFERAHRFVRAAARRRPGEPLPAAEALARLSAELSVFRSSASGGLADFLAADREALHLPASMLRFNNLKLTSAEQAPRICLGALTLIGMAGYRTDSPYSVGRQLRDAASAALMVSNDRIYSADATLLTVAKTV